MGRSPCCDKMGLKKGPWTPEEDNKLLAYVQQHGHGSWRALPSKAGLQRCGKSCRLRWTNYLRPDIKRGKFSSQEEQTIIQLHALLGNRWSAIATHMPKRTDNEIKNYWNTHLKKRLTKMGIDPLTHKPKNNALLSSDGDHSKNAAKLSHMAQWETARLEAEARLVRESKLRSVQITRCVDMQKAWKEGDIVESPTSTLIPIVGICRDQTRTEEVVHWKHQQLAVAEINNIHGFEETTTFQSGWESTSEKFTDLLLSDNNNYWNSILNMLNSPQRPSDDSPMF